MSATAVGAYRLLLRLYPRRFRDEYAADMALVFAEQLRDEPANSVWMRGLVDLAITVPHQHLETHMTRPPSALMPVLFAGAGFAGVCMAVIGGTNAGMLAVGLAIAVIAGGLAAVAWRNVRPLPSEQRLAAHWWKFLAAGATVLSLVIGTTTATGELPEGLWLPTMATILCALMLLATGLALAVAHHSATHPRKASS